MIATANRLASVQEYYFSRKLREVAQMVQEGHPVINLGIGSPDLPPHPEVVKALSDAMVHPRANMYQSYQGLPELRSAITDFYQNQYQVALDPNTEVLPLMGSKEGIMHISMAFLNKGDQVLFPNPGYPTYASVTKLVEAEPILYNLTAASHWQPDFEALEALDTSRVKIMWINYPHMPTGAEAQLETFDRLITWAKARKILLVNDNPYSFVLTQKPQSILSRPGAMEVAIELNSLSKSFNMAGWRVGMLSGKAALIQAVLKVKSNMDSGMFFGIQQGAIAALKADASWFESLNTIYRKRRKLVEKLATKLGAEFDSESVGLFVWAKLPKGSVDAETFIDNILHKQHIFITPGTIFGSQGDGYIRFSLCVPETTIEEAINRIES
ncbi:aminotransferase class I/II-fold pyridoxal phosphate-dependent enzyme [Flavobacteriaceae bacterium]|jgi:LL-diaminopimelate aminotransferase|nr:aminotransferase class I/II-fold pyridoxal phosphate-dependent enzyme [Flavobacteriaceae bacterium]MBT4313973.1 aminotransferase class I/II-fold pyridoxal phosphate-dependent enzyme [Flavobacteriaceae bacterium]MBT5091123.1 aminotransferase class I/II-fold pyridoxal phosphate-dependent enzyme [Flavobacteriaceae bacterium]MBT5282710.1 aminotransferase class I/II-fold pyridoxal phosphate-dependent enzyme [Flavobacteriaceae bacterium]MBT5446876.1 aminotransferase class I/II-fold pyridoxal phosp